jgi:hypothetical protein
MTIKVSLTTSEIETLRSVLIDAANTAANSLDPEWAEKMPDYFMSIRRKLFVPKKKKPNDRVRL